MDARPLGLPLPLLSLLLLKDRTPLPLMLTVLLALAFTLAVAPPPTLPLLANEAEGKVLDEAPLVMDAVLGEAPMGDRVTMPLGVWNELSWDDKVASALWLTPSVPEAQGEMKAEGEAERAGEALEKAQDEGGGESVALS